MKRTERNIMKRLFRNCLALSFVLSLAVSGLAQTQAPTAARGPTRGNHQHARSCMSVFGLWSERGWECFRWRSTIPGKRTGTIHIQNAAMGYLGQHHVHTAEHFEKWRGGARAASLVVFLLLGAQPNGGKILFALAAARPGVSNHRK